MHFENLRYELTDGVAVITMIRSKALNALNSATLNDLRQAFALFAEDPAAKCAVITGEGKAFVAGADIGEMAGLDVEEGRQWGLRGQELFDSLEKIEKPIIAAVNGYALGGGCELAMACDMRIASEKAVFGQPEIKLGLIPGFGGTQRLPRLVGGGIAKELLYTGRNVAAEEALRIGLVNAVVAPDALMDEALGLARRISAYSGLILRYMKLAANRGADMDLYRAMEIERDLFGLCFATADHREGCRAFLEKREPAFSDR